ncbi:MAG: hypothetical protein Q9217_006165, partial [Psora testacea]
TTGIGKAAVFALASHNPSCIYFTGRNAQAGSSVVTEAKHHAPTCPVNFIQCDLSSSRDTIRRTIRDNFKSSRLDLFIANAGVMAVPAGLTAEGFEVQFGTNYIGHAIMLRLLRPLMLRTVDLPDGGDVRLVMLSSWGHHMHPPDGIQFDQLKSADAGTKWSRYGQSKLADIFLAKSMAKHYPQITSVSVHPGLVRTDLAGRVESGVLASVGFTLMSWTPLYQNADKGAYNALWAAASPKAKLENGAYYDPVGKRPGKLTKTGTGVAEICSDERLAEKLWKWTENELESLEAL